MSKNNDSFMRIFGLFFILLQLDFVHSIRKFYMEDDCAGLIDMGVEAIPAGRLSVTRRSKYRSTLTCRVTIKAPLDRKIVVVFREMDIEWESNCDDDYVSLHDGSNAMAPILPGTRPRMCGYLIPNGNYVTSGNSLTVVFQSDVFKQDNGFEIVFTAFHKARSCFVDELQCDNRRCIAASLRCDNFDNCGDNSDECEVNTEVAIAIALSVFLLTVIGVGVILLYKKQKRKHRSKKRQDIKAAIIKTASLSKNTLGIHLCEACSLKKLSTEKQQRFANQAQHSVCCDNEAYVEDISADMSRVYKEKLWTYFSDTNYRASI